MPWVNSLHNVFTASWFAGLARKLLRFSTLAAVPATILSMLAAAVLAVVKPS